MSVREVKVREVYCNAKEDDDHNADACSTCQSSNGMSREFRPKKEGMGREDHPLRHPFISSRPSMMKILFGNEIPSTRNLCKGLGRDYGSG